MRQSGPLRDLVGAKSLGYALGGMGKVPEEERLEAREVGEVHNWVETHELHDATLKRRRRRLDSRRDRDLLLAMKRLFKDFRAIGRSQSFARAPGRSAGRARRRAGRGHLGVAEMRCQGGQYDAVMSSPRKCFAFVARAHCGTKC